MTDYPKTKYHLRGGGSITVTSAAQEKALGAEWVDHPHVQTVTVEMAGGVPIKGTFVPLEGTPPKSSRMTKSRKPA